MDQVIAFLQTGTGPREVPVSEENPLPIVGTITTTPGPPEPVVPGSGTKGTVKQGSILPASAATPERLAPVGTYVSFVTIIGQRLARVANTSSVFIGATSVNGEQLVELTPGGTVPGVNGSSYSLAAPPGRVIDLGDIWVDIITVGDGATYFGIL